MLGYFYIKKGYLVASEKYTRLIEKHIMTE